jgi:hypothetical protein
MEFIFPNNGQDREAKEPQRLTEIEQFSDDDLCREISKKKTMFAPVIAEQIVKSDRKPSLINCFSKSLPSSRKTITSDSSFDELLFLNCFFTRFTVKFSESLNINQGIFNMK